MCNEAMENYYQILGLDSKLPTDQLRLILARENKKYRDRASLDNPEIVLDATEKLRHIQQAMIRFKTDEDRQEYDLELEESQTTGGFVDYYRALSISPDTNSEFIANRINEIEEELRHRPSDRAAIRDRRLLRESKRILLNEEERRQYDVELKAVERSRRPIPLRVGANKLYEIDAIVPSFDENPREAVELLLDGDIEAWLRWSLGNKQDADAVRRVAQIARDDKSPYFALDGLIRAINQNHPLSLYELKVLHGLGTTPRLNTPIDLIAWADKYPRVIASGLGFILPWVRQKNAIVYEKLEQVQKNGFKNDINVTLERLLAAIDPNLLAPAITISGTQSNWRIDFGRFSKTTGGTGSRTLGITNNGRGYVYGIAKSNVSWLEISPSHFSGNSCSVKITPIYSEIFPLQVGYYSARITINLIDNRVQPVSIDVKIEVRRF